MKRPSCAVAIATALLLAPALAAGTSALADGARDEGKPRVRMYFKPALIRAEVGEVVKASVMIDSGGRKVYGAGVLTFFSDNGPECVRIDAAKGWSVWYSDCEGDDTPELLADAEKPTTGVSKLGTIEVNVGDPAGDGFYLVQQHPGSYVELKRGLTQKIKVERLRVEIER